MSTHPNPDDLYIETLVTASQECVRCCELLQEVVLGLPLTSPIATCAHRMMWTVGNVETALHQFIDRELLHEPYARRRENGGARLQDAIESARGSLKPTVKASLLAGGECNPSTPCTTIHTRQRAHQPRWLEERTRVNHDGLRCARPSLPSIAPQAAYPALVTAPAPLLAGIASLLHLFAHTLVQLNSQLERVLAGEAHGASWLDVTAVAGGYLLAASVPQRHRRLRRASMAAVVLLSARLVRNRLLQRQLEVALKRSSERLTLTLQLWHLATSVLQRAHRAVATSYIELDRLDRVERRDSNASPSLLPVGGLGGIGSASGLGLNLLIGSGSGIGGGGGGMTSSRSYPQLIARPGLQDVDDERKTAIRLMWETCVPWSDAAFWWQQNSVLALSKRLIEGYYGAYSAARRAVLALCGARSNSSQAQAATYALATALLPIYMLSPRMCADEVYHHVWIEPDITMLQAVFAPLRWPLAVSLVRCAFGGGITHEEHRLFNVKVVVMRLASSTRPSTHRPTRPSRRTAASGAYAADVDGGEEAYPAAVHPPVAEARGESGGVDGGESDGVDGGADGGVDGGGDPHGEGEDEAEIPTVPTILFVPGGGFISDFEAPDRFFLYKWVRATSAALVYVTYEFAPQAPFPTQIEQVRAVYSALRTGSHAAQLGFRASPLVLAGLSAGGNLAVSALLYPMLRPSCPSPPPPPRARPPTEPLLGAASSLEISATDLGGTRTGELDGRAPPTGGGFGGWSGGRAAHEAGQHGHVDDAELHMPDALLLLCPTLNSCRSPSPSRLAFSSDPLLPQPLLFAFATAYDPDSSQLESSCDPMHSPIFAPDEVLQRLPPTCIQVGGFDPLLDDSVDFNTRIRRLGVPGELRIYRSLPHTFVSFPHWHLMPEVQEAMRQAVDWLQAWLWLD